MWDNSIFGPMQMFKNNPVVQKGKQFYDNLLAEKKCKEDEAKWESVKYFK
jgi:hypothetical protein